MTHFPPRWTPEEIEDGVARGIEAFREERLAEVRDAYTSHFRDAQAAVEQLLDLTVDLTELRSVGREALARYPEALRYTAAPPVSEDDLAAISGVRKRDFTSATHSHAVVSTLEA